MASTDATIHRIYQGRARRYVREDPAAPTPKRTKAAAWVPDADGASAVWAHHALFQDAVNYYLVALVALAGSSTTAIGRVPDRLAECWTTYRRRAIERRGLGETLRPYLGEHPDLASAMEAVLRGNEATEEVRSRALEQLVAECSGDSGIQQEGRTYLPRFCDPQFGGKFLADKLAKDAGREILAGLLHAPAVSGPTTTVLGQLRFEWFANLDSKRPAKTGDEARQILLEGLDVVVGFDQQLATERDRIATAIRTISEPLPVPAYAGGSINKDSLKHRFFAYLLATRLPDEPVLFDALKRAVPAPKARKSGAGKAGPGSDMDPVAAARGARGYVFPAFTALPIWAGADGTTPTWKEFDIAAFKEALKTINQFSQKQQERETKRAALAAQVAWIREGTGTSAKAFTGPEWAEADRLPGTLRGDPRGDRLLRLLDHELATSNELTDGQATAYRLRQRTVRGFHELADRWNRALDRDAATTPDQLIALCDEHQAKHRDDVGSVALFRALAQDRTCWPIWRTPSAAETAERNRHGWSDDLLADVARLHEAEEDLEEIRDPVMVTPADADHSRRLYPASDLDGKVVDHDGHPAIELTIARRTDGAWGKQRTRIPYSAPRLRRDGLHAAQPRWLPPMLAALVQDPPTHDFSKTAIQLMPDRGRGRTRLLINFPAALDVTAVQQAVGIAGRWNEAQFNHYDDAALHLHWPETTVRSAAKRKADWWTSATPFAVLGVDLGQRTAGAMARIQVQPDTMPATVGQGWHLGDAGGGSWNGRLDRTRLLRLPGEEAHIWTGTAFAREAYGRRGRPATAEETADATAFLTDCPAHHLEPDILAGLSFPEQNDTLLVAARRAQGWLARCHRWRWMLTTADKRDAALKEMAEDQRLPAITGTDAAAESARLGRLDAEIAGLKAALPVLLLRLTARILPLRGRGWEWGPHPMQDGCHVLRQTEPGSCPGRVRIRGQRGLSLARIEQIEELRVRWQSLNRTLMITPGARPPSGRELRNQPVPDACPDLLDKLERLKDQRIDQTAHLIVAEALGVELTLPGDRDTRRREHRHGEYRRRTGRDGQPVAPVAAIVMEDLGRYLTSQDRAPSENSRLMKWCHRAVLLKVKMLCEPLGIPVVETNAAYSSRFCSRTGVAGFRAVEVVAADRTRFPWSKALARVEQARRDGTAVKPEDQAIAEVFAALARLGPAPAGKPPRTLVLPKGGGPLFVPMRDWSGGDRIRPGIQQADINAAISIALRGIAGPAARRIRTRLRLERGDGGWSPRQVSQMERSAPAVPSPIELPTSGTGSYLTAFIDWGGVATFEVVDAGSLRLASGKGLWTAVKQGAWQRIADINRQRIATWDRGPLPF